jgi:hypothetical protein
MPAASVSLALAKRMEDSIYAGTPSRWELDVSSCSTVASGLARGERYIVASERAARVNVMRNAGEVGER